MPNNSDPQKWQLPQTTSTLDIQPGSPRFKNPAVYQATALKHLQSPALFQKVDGSFKSCQADARQDDGSTQLSSPPGHMTWVIKPPTMLRAPSHCLDRCTEDDLATSPWLVIPYACSCKAADATSPFMDGMELGGPLELSQGPFQRRRLGQGLVQGPAWGLEQVPSPPWGLLSQPVVGVRRPWELV